MLGATYNAQKNASIIYLSLVATNTTCSYLASATGAPYYWAVDQGPMRPQTSSNIGPGRGRGGGITSVIGLGPPFP